MYASLPIPRPRHSVPTQTHTHTSIYTHQTHTHAPASTTCTTHLWHVSLQLTGSARSLNTHDARQAHTYHPVIHSLGASTSPITSPLSSPHLLAVRYADAAHLEAALAPLYLLCDENVVDPGDRLRAAACTQRTLSLDSLYSATGRHYTFYRALRNSRRNPVRPPLSSGVRQTCGDEGRFW